MTEAIGSEVSEPMRQRRIKLSAAEGAAAYHCVSRAVNREHLFGASAREILRRQIWKVADFCGVEVLTYAILSNHFHVLILVPEQRPVSDEELLRRYTALHSSATKCPQARVAAIRAELAANSLAAATWRRRQLALMGDISPYMKLLKQGFSIWFNRHHRRIGTLWCERFKSSLVEAKPHVLRTIAAYIDLNPVRAGLVKDPKDYRFCGYAEAVAGESKARSGLARVLSEPSWDSAHSTYRLLLFGTGSIPRPNAASLSQRTWTEAARCGGNLSLAEILRCRFRYFTDGVVLGSHAFVNLQWARHRRDRSRIGPTRLPPPVDWGDFVALQSPRKYSAV